MKIFNLYSTAEVKVEDPGLKDYINTDEKLVLRNVGRAREKFAKVKVNVVERLANLLAVPGHRGKKHKIITHSSGKYTKNMKTVIEALEIVQKRTNTNPIQVLVDAIVKGSPRDEITVIEHSGAKYPQTV